MVGSKFDLNGLCFDQLKQRERLRVYTMKKLRKKESQLSKKNSSNITRSGTMLSDATLSNFIILKTTLKKDGRSPRKNFSKPDDNKFKMPKANEKTGRGHGRGRGYRGGRGSGRGGRGGKRDYGYELTVPEGTPRIIEHADAEDAVKRIHKEKDRIAATDILQNNFDKTIRLVEAATHEYRIAVWNGGKDMQCRITKAHNDVWALNPALYRTALDLHRIRYDEDTQYTLFDMVNGSYRRVSIDGETDDEQNDVSDTKTHEKILVLFFKTSLSTRVSTTVSTKTKTTQSKKRDTRPSWLKFNATNGSPSSPTVQRTKSAKRKRRRGMSSEKQDLPGRCHEKAESDQSFQTWYSQAPLPASRSLLNLSGDLLENQAQAHLSFIMVKHQAIIEASQRFSWLTIISSTKYKKRSRVTSSRIITLCPPLCICPGFDGPNTILCFVCEESTKYTGLLSNKKTPDAFCKKYPLSKRSTMLAHVTSICHTRKISLFIVSVKSSFDNSHNLISLSLIKMDKVKKKSWVDFLQGMIHLFATWNFDQISFINPAEQASSFLPCIGNYCAVQNEQTRFDINHHRTTTKCSSSNKKECALFCHNEFSRHIQRLIAGKGQWQNWSNSQHNISPNTTRNGGCLEVCVMKRRRERSGHSNIIIDLSCTDKKHSKNTCKKDFLANLITVILSLYYVFHNSIRKKMSFLGSSITPL